MCDLFKFLSLISIKNKVKDKVISQVSNISAEDIQQLPSCKYTIFVILFKK